MNVKELKNLVGKELQPSDWLTIDQNRINQFADVTEDHQYIHVDTVRAKASPYKSTVAHGFLTLSMLAKLGENCIPKPDNIVTGINYGFDKIRFLNPVKSNDEIRMCATISNIKEQDSSTFIITLSATVQIKDQVKPALVCEWLLLHMVSDT